MPIIIAITTLFAMFAVICHIQAEKLGRPKVKWLALGMLFGPFALIMLLVLGKPKQISS